MLAEVAKKGPPGAGRLLTRFRDRLLPGLNSFVHGGIHPLRRKSDGYPESMLLNVIESSNASSLMTVLVLAAIASDPDILAGLNELNQEFGDCVPPPEPFPESERL